MCGRTKKMRWQRETERESRKREREQKHFIFRFFPIIYHTKRVTKMAPIESIIYIILVF